MGTRLPDPGTICPVTGSVVVSVRHGVDFTGDVGADVEDRSNTPSLNTVITALAPYLQPIIPHGIGIL